MKALPYGRDPVTCPPCAYARWREVLHAADTAPDDGARRAVMRVLRRQAAVVATNGEGEQLKVEEEEDGAVLHVCRTTRFPDPVHPGRALFPTVHKTGTIGAAAMSGDAVNEMIPRRAEQAGFSPAQIALLGGHFLRAGFVTEAFRQGADAHAIMRQTGHRSPAMLEVTAEQRDLTTGS